MGIIIFLAIPIALIFAGARLLFAVLLVFYIALLGFDRFYQEPRQTAQAQAAAAQLAERCAHMHIASDDLLSVAERRLLNGCPAHH